MIIMEDLRHQAKKNINDFKTLDNFKQYLESKAVSYIYEEKNEIFIEKMNMDSFFDWD